MDVANLRNFCTDKHPTLIELYKNGERWLFATDGFCAVGVRTNEFASNIEPSTSGKTQGVKDLFEASREFKPLRRQRFMTFLHLMEEEDKECTSCEGSERVPCPECDGEGTIECSECEGSGTIYSDCGECDGYGKKSRDCEECDGTGKDKCECDECGGTGKYKHECDDCDGTGFAEDEGAGCGCDDCRAADGKEEREKCSSCEGGQVEEPCEYCTDGMIEDSCSYCEEGQVEDDCEECEDGRVERDCEECDCGNVECHECDSDEDHTVECDDCDEEKKDVGVIYSRAFDLALLKDLGMDYFDEISPSREMTEPLALRGKGVQAFVMPMNVNLSTIHDRTYCP